MSIRTWLYKKGLPGAIARDLTRKHIEIKSEQLLDNETAITEKVWSLWLSMNEPHIRAEDSLDKCVRLDIIKEKYENEFYRNLYFKNLYTLYQNILYIETETNRTDKDIYNDCMKVFIEEAAQQDLDYTNEYSKECRVMNIR